MDYAAFEHGILIGFILVSGGGFMGWSVKIVVKLVRTIVG